MRAVVLRRPLDLDVEERATPEPGPGEVLVRIARGGICGSDLNYFRHGGFGTVRMKEPMILGHEIAGRVEALGAGVSGPAVGTAVAVNPANPCGVCAFCRTGQPIHCLDMRFLGRRCERRMCRAALPNISSAAPKTPCRWRKAPTRPPAPSPSLSP